jgi:hypothetical protein
MTPNSIEDSNPIPNEPVPTAVAPKNSGATNGAQHAAQAPAARAVFPYFIIFLQLNDLQSW